MKRIITGLWLAAMCIWTCPAHSQTATFTPTPTATPTQTWVLSPTPSYRPTGPMAVVTPGRGAQMVQSIPQDWVANLPASMQVAVYAPTPLTPYAVPYTSGGRALFDTPLFFYPGGNLLSTGVEINVQGALTTNSNRDNLVSRSFSDLTWGSIGYSSTVNASALTINAPIFVGLNPIHGVPTPSSLTDAANKKYVSDNYVPYSGAVSDVDLGSKNISTSGAVTANGVSRLSDVQSGTNNNFYNIISLGDSKNTSGSLGISPDNIATYPGMFGYPGNNAIFIFTYAGRTLRQQLTDMGAWQSVAFSPYCGLHVFTSCMGTNDIWQGTSPGLVEGYYWAVCNHARRMGADIIVAETLPSINYNGADKEANRVAYNALIRADWPKFADALSDVGSDPNLGCSGCAAADTGHAYIQSDGLHPTGLGATIIAGYRSAAVSLAVKKGPKGPDPVCIATAVNTSVPAAVATANAFSANLAATMTPLAANAVATEVAARQTAIAGNISCLSVSSSGPVTAASLMCSGPTSLGNSVTVSTKNISTNYLYDAINGNSILKSFVSLWNGSSWIAENNSMAFGPYVGYNNTGGNFTGSGAYVGYNNTRGNFTGSGAYVGYNNTGAYFTGSGAYVGYNNTGGNFTVSGIYVGYNNTGANFTGSGAYVGYNNTGANFTGSGANSGYNNTGGNNSSFGYQSNYTFKTNSGGAKTFSYANISGNTVTISGHGFGNPGEWHNVLFTQGTSPVTGLTNGTIYQIYIVSSSVISFYQNISGAIYHGTQITNPGTGTGHTLTPQFEYSNISCFGALSEPTASNQVMLGNTSVTQVYSYGSFTTPKNFISTNAEQLMTVAGVTYGMKGGLLSSINGTPVPTPIP